LRSELASFEKTYRISKAIGAVAAVVWLYGLLEVALAGILRVGFGKAVGVSLTLTVLLVMAAYLYFRAGMKTAESGGCAVLHGKQGCSQQGCDSASGGCLGKFDREIGERIVQMERNKLALLLRRRIGVEMVLPLFWIAVGAKLTFSSGSTIQLGGLALVAGSLGLAGARLCLGSGVFPRGVLPR
jgi:hypothetical protein